MCKDLKRPSNYFKSMEEVKLYAESIKGKVPEDIYNDILFLLGLEENRAITTSVSIENVEVEIDKYIADLVSFLNNNGLKPLASCSGLQEEHEHSLHKPNRGYLAIAYSDECFSYLFDYFSILGITVDKGECYLQPCITFYLESDSDESLKSLWDKLFEFFRKK